MFEKTSVPNSLLNAVGSLCFAVVSLSILCTRELLEELKIDVTDPVEVCEKINTLRGLEYACHFVLAAALVLRGWWGVGIANYPFLFYHLAQFLDGQERMRADRLLTTLRQEKIVTRAKLCFFSGVVAYYFLEWALWVPPPYLKQDEGYHVMAQCQVSH